jgi:hypothetical protein
MNLFPFKVDQLFQLSLFSIFSFLIPLDSHSSLTQNFELDQTKIKSMKGCYQVTFQNSETFSPVKDYQFSNRYSSRALEWIFVDEETENSIELQHLLIVPGMIIKHWRQNWDYQQNELYQYVGPMKWVKTNLNPEHIKREWTQKVFQVDDSPRYECQAPWIHTSQKSYWECETFAPLPRREFTVRSDYNMLLRNNRHEITSYGHLHDEDNTKINQTFDPALNIMNRVTLAEEKGKNIYKKVDDQKCLAAQEWWENHRTFWKYTRDIWKNVYQTHRTLSIEEKINGKTLWEEIFELDEKYSPTIHQTPELQVKSAITSTINKFIKNQ